MPWQTSQKALGNVLARNSGDVQLDAVCPWSHISGSVLQVGSAPSRVVRVHLNRSRPVRERLDESLEQRGVACGRDLLRAVLEQNLRTEIAHSLSMCTPLSMRIQLSSGTGVLLVSFHIHNWYAFMFSLCAI